MSKKIDFKLKSEFVKNNLINSLKSRQKKQGKKNASSFPGGKIPAVNNRCPIILAKGHRYFFLNRFE